MRVQPDPSITACDLAPILGENVRAGASASVVVLRPETAVVTKRTPTQAAWRIQFQSLVTLWRALTVPQLEAWDAWALDNPILNNCGDQEFFSTYNAFVHVNAVLLSFGEGFMIADPPVSFIPPVDTIDPLIEFDVFCGSDEAFLVATFTLPPGVGLQIWSAPHRDASLADFAKSGNLLFASSGQDDELYGEPPPPTFPVGQGQRIMIGLRFAWKWLNRPISGPASPPSLV